MSRCLVVFLVLAFLTVTCFSYAEDLKGYFIKHDTFLYLYLNAEKVQSSKIYASVDKYLIKDNYQEYSKLRSAAEKAGIKEGDISEIYFSSSLTNVKTTADIKQDNTSCLSGTVLKKNITNDRLLEILRESLKNEPSFTLKKINRANNEFLQIKTETGSMYIAVPQSKLILTGSDLSELAALVDSYKARKSKTSSQNISELLSQISSTASLYAVVAIPPCMIKEFQQINNKVKRNKKQQDVKYKINSAIRHLNGLAFEAKMTDTFTFKINTFFTTEEEAKSFNELLTQFIPLLKFQLFMMVQNSTLPVLNTIVDGTTNKSVLLSCVLTDDDFVSIDQMIKNKGKWAGF